MQGSVEQSYGYGGFWWRFLAAVIDTIVIGLLTPVVALFLPFLLPVIPILLDAAYSIILESSPAQGTVGKMVCRLKVADLQGRRITPGKAALRYVGKIVSTLILFIGYLLVFFTSKKQALHDLMAGTVVLKVTEHNENVDPIRGFHEEQMRERVELGQAQPLPPASDPQRGGPSN
ncbi:MAG: RDD family protein [Pseudomonadota bacterium]